MARRHTTQPDIVSATGSKTPSPGLKSRRKASERKNETVETAPCPAAVGGSFSIDAHAGAVSPNLHYGMQDGENRGVRFFDGGVFRLDEIDCMSSPESCVHKAAWYRDRDNSMSPVSTESGVGAAMAAIFSKNGVTQAIKVCPEVYLSTAHGVLDNPKNAKKIK